MPQIPRDTLIKLIDLEWPLAVEHAGIPQEKLSLWKAETTPDDLKGIAAHHFGPNLNPDPPYAFSEKQYEEATSAGIREKHRTVMNLDYDYPDGLSPEATQALIGALLRHELQHAQQIERWGPDLFNIYDQFVLPAMGRAFGGSIPNIHINLTPIEFDANSAAAEYLRQNHADHIPAIEKTNNGNLARIATPAQPVETLMSRTIAFLYLFRQQAEDSTGQLPVASYLEVYDKDAAATWRRLTDPAESAEGSST